MGSNSKEDKPIPGPSCVEPEYIWQRDDDRPQTLFVVIGKFAGDLVSKPVKWIRENVVEPNRGPKYYWYHRKFPRALPIDECYIDDYACIYEANLDYKRTYLVDRATLEMLRYRRDNCYFWHMTDHGNYKMSEKCQGLKNTYDEEELNFFIKYGDLSYNACVNQAYNKQKHRMIMERRDALRNTRAGEAEKEN